MNKFERGVLNLPPVKQYIAETMRNFGCTRAQAKEQYNDLKSDEIWLNDQFQVNVRRNTRHRFGTDIGEMMWLSIKRLDKKPIRDWRHFQEIKNLLAGPECEAIEIFPAESRLVDGANQYHLWCFPEGIIIPCGFNDGRAVTGESIGGTTQRPLGEELGEEA